MSVTRAGDRWQVRWYEAGRGSPRRRRTFHRRRDAVAFAADLDRRRQLGELAESAWASRPLDDQLADWWESHCLPNLSPRTLRDYARLLDRHVAPRLGGMRLRDVTLPVVDSFRRDLERAGVRGSQLRQTLVVLQGAFRHAEERGRVSRNPVRLVRKPSGRRQGAVVALAPARVEAVRGRLLAAGGLGDATLVSVLAYAGLRPQEALALGWRHVRDRTLLVERKNVDGTLVPGQKTGRPARTVPLTAPLRADLAKWRLARGSPDGLVFPTRAGRPWREHDYLNWLRRTWTPAARAEGVGATPYALRHSYASLRLREGVSIPELAQELGHSPVMTLGTYGHVIEELRDTERLTAEATVQRARERRGALQTAGRDDGVPRSRAERDATMRQPRVGSDQVRECQACTRWAVP